MNGPISPGRLRRPFLQPPLHALRQFANKRQDAEDNIQHAQTNIKTLKRISRRSNKYQDARTSIKTLKNIKTLKQISRRSNKYQDAQPNIKTLISRRWRRNSRRSNKYQDAQTNIKTLKKYQDTQTNIKTLEQIS